MADDLKRQLGLASATAAVDGEVIAVGIFLTPAGMAKSLGSPFWTLVVWLIAGAVALSGALCYGDLGARFPQAGGGYVYLREAYGSRLAWAPCSSSSSPAAIRSRRALASASSRSVHRCTICSFAAAP